MMRSLFSGVSGIKVHQTRMDVIGNNIANINTVGFKSSRTTFSDMFSQLQRAASAPTDRQGGINPRQIGLGVNVESIDLMFADASPQQTGKNTDLALAGNGLFILRNGDQSYYTRNGAFMFDEQGYYVLPGSGLRVQGWNATSNGVIDTNALTTDIVVPVGKSMEATETTEINYSGNLDKESRIIESITYTEATGVDVDANRVVTTTNSYSTPINITTDGFGAVTAMVNGNTYYASGAEVSGVNASISRGERDTTAGTDENPQYFYNITYTDSSGRTLGRATSTASYTEDNAPTVGTITATASENSTLERTMTNSVNVDGQNVLAAKITFKDGTTMNVTSGYYEVGRSVPVTTLATVYDTLGGKHEVTLLLDKDDTTTDTNLTDPNALLTATLLGTDGNKIEYDTLTATRDEDGNITSYAYTYTDADGNTQEGTANLNQVVFYNRWRVYIAPGVGEQGPASTTFDNSYERSQANKNPEADGSKTVGTMNAINYIYFNDRGQFVSNGQDNDGTIVFEYSEGNGAASNQAVLGFAGLTQYANSTTSFPTSNGNAAGILQSLAINASGVITGTYTNGLSRTEAQIAIAQFQNAAGLTKAGTTIYQESNNSGQANIKTVDDFGMTVTASALEMSNVDLATEFSDMIITQRGFQANSKMTTVSDEMLETLVNMKR